MSVPAKLTAAPGTRGARTSTYAGSPGSTSVTSIGATASAPRGSMPPVAMVVAVPLATSIDGAMPVASTSSFRRSRTGSSSEAPKLSAARIAKPSMFERSKPGTSTAAFTSAASTRPSPRSSGIVSVPSAA